MVGAKVPSSQSESMTDTPILFIFRQFQNGKKHSQIIHGHLHHIVAAPHPAFSLCHYLGEKPLVVESIESNKLESLIEEEQQERVKKISRTR